MCRLRGDALFSCQPTCGRPGEGDHGDVGMVVPDRNDLRRPAGDDIQPARGQARLGQRLGQQAGRERRTLRRLEHHGAAGRERRRHLVHHQVEREVEGGDRRHDAERLGRGEPERGHSWTDLVELHGLGRQPACLLGRDPQGADGSGDLDAGRGDRFAGLGADLLGEVLRAFGNQLAGLEQHVRSRGGRPAAQHGRLGRRDSLRCLLRAGHGDAADQALVERVPHLEGVDPGDPVAVDEELLITHGKLPLGWNVRRTGSTRPPRR